MIIFPAIDIKNRKCVRLYKGDFDTTEVMAEDPVEVAKKFEAAGAEYLHIVDLDGAQKGVIENIDIIENIINSINIPIELGGGIRDIETINSLIKKGVSRVILGTAALNNKDLVLDALKKHKEKIAISIDAKNELVAINGWVNLSEVNYIDFAKEMENIGVGTIIFTDISKDGTLKGPNYEQLTELNKNVKCNIIASGGIKDINDIIKLKEMNLYGAITGKAIYSGNINLEEALKL
ncbi:1-(5-phosphoribosyl)-5-[(5-phosphoribosylamino)methylideneamino]imidazole-4-carboxamide isomerase [Clostridium aestuarii]|uniref:1-(5-phosphoribosyl)-5-[(5-phosphoribosylamino)methylideneamino] imidazole-4-carboxamide isomerase n=1 Tax=Clostridium aestuarii TaxID=338193 RepID=A0ABT4CV68_9CLOT|nr:1-(5-phosphoribosyl)-5-[(5-phosphoribosylamino)methylideneamino]imidazole-4-carboxamide isomerase [Clostridium aestuarii]MCY6482884.1 1-(5-phosphoribosyl)-5-[(5-phosphoribosylamino)methylideneamino]imidazole-4-carboxamide isomerase [Clostridium aestuarii]